MILNVKKHALFASEGAQVFLRTDAEATQSKDLSLRIFVIFEDVHELFTPRDSGHFRIFQGYLKLCRALLSQLHPGCRPATRPVPSCLFPFGVAEFVQCCSHYSLAIDYRNCMELS